MKMNKILINMLCASIIMSNTIPVYAVTSEASTENETFLYEDNTNDDTKNTLVFCEQTSSYFVTIPKTISLGIDKISPYSVKVEGDIAGDKRVYVSPIDGIKSTNGFDFYMHDTSIINPKSDVVATVSHNKFYWDYTDVANGYEETNNQISALDLTSGHWQGTFDFEINMYSDFALTTDGDMTIVAGGSKQINAYIDRIESNNDVTWSCDNSDVTISNGFIEIPSTVPVGTQITVTVTKDDKTASLIITVCDDFALTTDGDMTIVAGGSKQINAYIDGVESNDDVTWSCNNSDVTINNGFIEIPSTVPVGTLITVTVTKDGKTASLIITVGNDFTLTTDGDTTIPAGGSEQLNAYIDGVESNDDVTWSCDNSDVTINNGFIEIPSTVPVGTQLTIKVTKNGKQETLVITVAHVHNYVMQSTDATCTTAGTGTFVCEECGDTYTATVDALGHNFVSTANTANVYYTDFDGNFMQNGSYKPNTKFNVNHTNNLFGFAGGSTCSVTLYITMPEAGRLQIYTYNFNSRSYKNNSKLVAGGALVSGHERILNLKKGLNSVEFRISKASNTTGGVSWSIAGLNIQKCSRCGLVQ